MSENPIVEGQTSGGEGTPEIKLEEVLARLQQLESTNNRLLDENKKFKTKYKETTSLYENAEREKLEKEGNFQALLESERKRVEKLEQESKEMKAKVLKSNVFLEVSKYAGDVHDLDDLLNQPKYSHILTSAIDSESLSVDGAKVKEYVNEVLKVKPWMKKINETPTTITGKPSMTNVPEKKIEEMTSKELEEFIKKQF